MVLGSPSCPSGIGALRGILDNFAEVSTAVENCSLPARAGSVGQDLRDCSLHHSPVYGVCQSLPDVVQKRPDTFLGGSGPVQHRGDQSILDPEPSGTP